MKSITNKKALLLLTFIGLLTFSQSFGQRLQGGNPQMQLNNPIPAPDRVSIDWNYNSNQIFAYFVPQALNANLQYHWEFGDGGESAQPDATHIYANPGFYTVILRVYKTGILISTRAKTVWIN